MEFAFWNTLRVKTKKIGNQLLPSSTDKPRIAPLMAAIPFNFRLPARTFSIFQIVCEAAKLREGVLFSWHKGRKKKNHSAKFASGKSSFILLQKLI